MRWTIAQMAYVLAARTGAGLNPLARLAGVSIDSRTVRPGELFVAIHGPRHDGHDHVAAALGAGAAALLVAAEKVGGYSETLQQKCVVVGDTFVALKQFARA